MVLRSRLSRWCQQLGSSCASKQSVQLQLVLKFTYRKVCPTYDGRQILVRKSKTVEDLDRHRQCHPDTATLQAATYVTAAAAAAATAIVGQ